MILLPVGSEPVISLGIVYRSLRCSLYRLGVSTFYQIILNSIAVKRQAAYKTSSNTSYLFDLVRSVYLKKSYTWL